MLKKIKKLALVVGCSLSLMLISSFSIAAALSVEPGPGGPGPGPPGAGTSADIRSSLCQGTEKLTIDSSGGTGCSTTDQTSGFNDLLHKVINIFSVIVGVIAVIMIIVGGFRYITSGGKEEGVKGAKNTILYALIGLVIVAIAQVIVKFVLTNAPPGA